MEILKCIVIVLVILGFMALLVAIMIISKGILAVIGFVAMVCFVYILSNA